MENGLPTQREIKNEMHSSYIIPMCGFIHVFSFVHEHFFIQNTQDKKACACLLLSHVQLPAIPWTVAHQGPLSVGFPRQEYWSGLPFLPPEFRHLISNHKFDPWWWELRKEGIKSSWKVIEDLSGEEISKLKPERQKWVGHKEMKRKVFYLFFFFHSDYVLSLFIS